MDPHALGHFTASIAAGLLAAGTFLLAAGARPGVGWGMLLTGLALGWVSFETSQSSSWSAPPSRRGRER